MRKLILGALLLPIALADVHAQQPGDLDTTFSGDGKLTIPGYDTPAAVVVQPDGKTLVATSTTDSTGKVFAILRLNYDGSMDPTFGVNGVALTDVGPGNDEPSDMVLQADGKFIVTNKHGWCLVRFLPNGQVDNNWAVNGVMRIDFAGWTLRLYEIALSNEKVMMVGAMDTAGVFGYWESIMRLNAFGAPDSTFSSDGVIVRAPSMHFPAFDVDVFNDGRYMLTGHSQSSGPPGGFVNGYIYDENGSWLQSYRISPVFSNPGPRKTVLTRMDTVLAMLSGPCFIPSDAYCAIGIVPPGDIPDGGCLVWNDTLGGFGVNDVSVRDISPDAVGHFLVCGVKAGVWKVGRTAINSGSFDPAFDVNGSVETVFDLGGPASAERLASCPNGMFLATGVATVNGVQHLTLARYHNIPDPRARLSVKVFLGGPYNALDQRMNDGLRASGLLTQQQQPYAAVGDSAVANPDALFAWPGTMDITGDSAAVDWVWLELLSTVDSTTVLGARAALVLRNGAVVDRDGRLPVDMNCGAGAYFLRISHRNHLSVTCSDPLQLSDSLTSVDFTSPSTNTFGIAAQKEVNGVRMLWPGDVTHDGAVRYAGANNDRDTILQALGALPVLGTVAGYRAEDANMDGLVKYAGANNDRDVILQTIGGGNVLGVRYEQLP